MPEFKEPTPNESKEEDVIRKLSHTVLEVASRRRKPLFEVLTKKNAEKIADLLKKKPVFYENQEDIPQQILLDPEIAESLPDDFFKNPFQWIESQANIDRGYVANLPSGENIEELWEYPYDISKVKEFDVLSHGKKQRIVSKRIDIKKLDEITRAQQAYDAGIPTPKVLGEIIDHGNTYAWFQHIPGRQLGDVWRKFMKDKIIPDKSNLPHFAVDEKMFEQDLKGLRIAPKIKEKLKKLWEKYFFDICCNSLCAVLGKNDSQDSENFIRSYPPAVIEKILNEIGFLSLEDYWQYMNQLYANHNYDAYEAVLGRQDQIRQRYQGSIEKFDDEAMELLWESAIGFYPKKELEILEKQCADKGIGHKDLKDRNILIPWDFKKDKPLKRKTGEPKMYIIDWEGPKYDKKEEINKKHEPW